MALPNYQQDLRDMEKIIFKFYSNFCGARDRLNFYDKKDQEEFPEKIEMYALLKQLKDKTASYNKTTKDNNLENIILEDYETFETIIKKLDENESEQDIKCIDFAQKISHAWHEMILEQKNKIKS
ncbi:MAG: hypothetical protein KAI18_00500 [Candidatus Aenigmarchaeota archaeon]|nr:hypothetical protein [Candidatus Aenigmarchaeota archaeon]